MRSAARRRGNGRRRPARSRPGGRRARAGSPSRRRAGRRAARASRRGAANSLRSALQIPARAQFARVDAVGDHGDAPLVDVEDVRDMPTHVVGADDHPVGAPGHPPLDRVDVRLRGFVHPALMATVLGGVDRRDVGHAEAVREPRGRLGDEPVVTVDEVVGALLAKRLRRPRACPRSSAPPSQRSGRGPSASPARARGTGSRPPACAHRTPRSSPSPRVRTSTCAPWRTRASASLRT